MKILLVHNYYRHKGGEDIVFEEQFNLLKENKIDVLTYTKKSINKTNLFYNLYVFFSGIINPIEIVRFYFFLKKTKPDIIHIHNLYPIISPFILPVCKLFKIPTVMTLHNYRLVCPTGLFLRNNKSCEDCSGGREWNCIKYNCEQSMLKSIAYATRNYVARKMNLYKSNISAFIALTHFQKDILIKNGYPESKIHVLGNTRQQTTVSTSLSTPNSYIAYVGRLSHEKGINLLVDLAKSMPNIPFLIAGTGPIDLSNSKTNNIQLLGQLSPNKVDYLIKNCLCGIITSKCYEGFPLTLLEYMQARKICFVPQLGGMPEIVGHIPEIIFKPSDLVDLYQKVELIINNPTLRIEIEDKLQQRFFNLYEHSVYKNNLLSLYNNLFQQKND